MAELIVIAGVSITVPMVLKAAGMALQAGYDIYMAYDDACGRREQVGVSLARCKDILQAASQDKRLSQETGQNNGDKVRDPYISRRFTSNATYEGSASGQLPSQQLTAAVMELETACKLSAELALELKKKRLGWYILFRGKADKKFQKITDCLNRAVENFEIKVLVANFNLQKEISAAQAKDNEELQEKVESIADMDKEILGTLKEIGENVGGIQKVMVEVLDCKKLLEGLSLPRKQAEFVRRTAIAVTIASKGRISVNKITIDTIASAKYAIEFESISYNEEDDHIGQGGFGVVFRAEWNGVPVAIKRIHEEDAALSNREGHISILQEVGIWKELRHPNILTFYGACVESTSPMVVMEYCEYGNVLSYLQNPVITRPNRIELAYNIASGINYLHDRKIIHRDLKGVNILVNNTHKAVLADFGLSSVLQDIRTRSRTLGGSTKNIGTPYWTAPELYDGKRMTEKSDIYSMGLTIWELYSGEIPYQDLEQVSLLVDFVLRRNKRPERPASLTSNELWNIVVKCWDASPDLRPSAKEVQIEIGRLRFESIKAGPPSFSVVQGHPKQQWRTASLSSPPRWTRGNPRNYLDSLTIPNPPNDQRYKYRVMKGDIDLGIQPTYERDPDGSQRVNLLEYNQGYGISDRTRIRVYAVDEEGSEDMVVEWPGSN